jgi:pimeloyl-ACP methyl ester carboxylesterase
MDAFLPGVGDWEAYLHNPRRWHFTSNGTTAEALVSGRERIYLDQFWNDFAADPRRSLSEAKRSEFTTVYASPRRMRAAWSYFEGLPQTAREFGILARRPLTMPVLVLVGEKAAGAGTGAQVSLVASHVTPVVVAVASHWLVEERFDETNSAIDGFVQAPRRAP